MASLKKGACVSSQPLHLFSNLKKESAFRSIVIVVFAAIFYCYEFTLQSSPGVITNELMSDFRIDAASLSILSAFFFYAYAPTQLIGGMLYDRLGPRTLITIATLICALGTIIFALGPNPEVLAVGRLFMGLGGAFSFVGVLILASRWIPLKYFPLCAGLLQSLGCLGAIFGQVPLAAAIHHFGWRECFVVLAVVGVVLAACEFSVIRDWPEHIIQRLKAKSQRVKVDDVAFGQSLKIVFGKKQTYWIALYAFTVWAPIVVFGALWGIPFIHTAYQISITEASTVVMLLWLGIAAGSPLFGVWSSRLGSRKIPLATSGMVGAVAAVIAIYVPMPLPMMYVVMFFFGIGASGQTLIFSVVKDINQPGVLGTAMGFNNLCVVLGGAICQPLAGFLLRLHWDGLLDATHNPIYSLGDFKEALIIVPIAFALAFFIATFFLKETHCRHTY
tara:strand:+ start:12410 stop:13747 length:1338 start_codon:yes stop_codon:yes gene_type:complete